MVKCLLLVMPVALASSVTVAAQSAPKAPVKIASAKAYVPTRTPWGDPDLHGNFTNKYEQATPFERPQEFEGKRIEDVQGQELADAVKRRQQQQIDRAPFLSGDPTGKIAGPMEFRDIYEISKAARPWFVVDPPDGKIPPVTPEGQRRIAARPRTGSSFSNGVYNGPEDLSLYDRCITRGYPNSMLPAIYGDSYQIIQGQGFVAIRIEMIHETRVIPLGSVAARQQTNEPGHGRRARSLGRRHARRGNDEFQGPECLPQCRSTEAAPRRTVHPHGPRHDRVVRHGRRDDDVDAAVDVLDAVDPERPRADLRVRVSRGQLRNHEHPERLACGGFATEVDARSGSEAGHYRATDSPAVRLKPDTTDTQRTAPPSA